MKLSLFIICSLVLPLIHAETPLSEERASLQLNLPASVREGTKLQIFLDQKQFGPGIIDGKPGTFTKLAIENYNVSLGREPNDQTIHEEVLASITEPYATAIVPAIVDEYINSKLPSSRELQAKVQYMSYRSVLEFMSERYHASEDLLIQLNGKKAINNAKARSAMIVPNITPFKIEDLKAGKSHKKEENLTARHIIVDTGTKQVYVYELKLPPEGDVIDEKPARATPVLIASFPITPGKTQFIPKGYWNLKNSIELPTWRYDKKLLETGVRGKESLNIPAGPNNPVGIIWNGLTKSGIGIHGTNNPNTIGRARSAGCIRLSNWDAALIPQLVRPGAVVVIK